MQCGFSASALFVFVNVSLSFKKWSVCEFVNVGVVSARLDFVSGSLLVRQSNTGKPRIVPVSKVVPRSIRRLAAAALWIAWIRKTERDIKLQELKELYAKAQPVTDSSAEAIDET